MAVIAGVCTMRNEADIIRSTVLHLLEEGVDRIYLADGCSTDGTREQVEDLQGVAVITDREKFHRQPRWIRFLGEIARYDGATWIIPFDADEYWYPTHAPSIKEALCGVPHAVGVLTARMYQQLDNERRCVDPQPFPKVAFRASPDAQVTNGNHAVSGVPGLTVGDVLDIRELKYRSFEHFKRKIKERNATIDPSLPVTDGWHHRRFEGVPESEVRQAWDSMQQVPVVHDPVPSSFLPTGIPS